MLAGADMIFTKSVKHLKAFNALLDRTGRVRENIAFNQAILSAPLPPIHDDEQEPRSQLTLLESINLGALNAKKRKLQEDTIATAMPPPVLRPDAQDQQLIPSLSIQGRSSPGLLSMAYSAIACVVSAVVVGSPLAAPRSSDGPDGPSSTTVQEDKIICAACLLRGNVGRYRKEHEQKNGRGVCPNKMTSTELTSLKTSAMSAMYKKGFVRRNDVDKYDSATYLRFLEK
jgi:hypothetical protein